MESCDPTRIGCYAGWRKYEGNPVIGEDVGETFDAIVLKLPDRYRMYFSWRSMLSVALAESKDGIHWSDPVIVMQADKECGWQDDVNRQIVLFKGGKYHMWFSGQRIGSLGQSDGSSYIGYATSEDGYQWKRLSDPVLVPTQGWELNSIMCTHVIWDEEMGLFRMWYSAGEWFEPDAIGYATSKDGIQWNKHERNPIFGPIAAHYWEREKVAACQVIKENGWHYMFYISYEDVHKATVSFARSRDGLTGWERHKDNPIITCGPAGAWDSEAIYKPYLVHENGRWLLWYNGNTRGIEHIGLAIHDGDDLWY